MALFHEDLQRNCNVGALSICDIYCVDTSQIKPLLDENPALQREMMAIIDSRVSINANIDHKVQSVASATCIYTVCTHTMHAYVHCTCTHCMRAECTCTANCPRHRCGASAQLLAPALSRLTSNYGMCPAHTL